MIEYVHGTLGDRPALWARTQVEVGADIRERTVLLGPWPADAPDPAGPRGLASIPVVVLHDGALARIAVAGARRAGRGSIAHLLADARSGLTLLQAAREGADVAIFEGGEREDLRTVRLLGGRPLAVLPLGRPDAVAAVVSGLDVDVHVPLPVPDDDVRERVRAIVQPLGLEALHHLVEVDPRPAFEELGEDARAADLDRLAAGAAGVLAGRLAAGNRRWREPPED